MVSQHVTAPRSSTAVDCAPTHNSSSVCTHCTHTHKHCAHMLYMCLHTPTHTLCTHCTHIHSADTLCTQNVPPYVSVYTHTHTHTLFTNTLPVQIKKSNPCLLLWLRSAVAAALFRQPYAISQHLFPSRVAFIFGQDFVLMKGELNLSFSLFL